MMSVTREQYLEFGGNVLSVTTLTFALAATWKGNTTVITSSCVLLLYSREGTCILCGFYVDVIEAHNSISYDQFKSRSITYWDSTM